MATSKRSYLLELPLEIRLMIYGHLFADLTIRNVFNIWVTWYEDSTAYDRFEIKHRPKAAKPNILFACRKLREEGLPYLVAATKTLVVQHTAKGQRDMIPDLYLSSVTRLVLDTTCPPEARTHLRLGRLPALQILEIEVHGVHCTQLGPSSNATAVIQSSTYDTGIISGLRGKLLALNMPRQVLRKVYEDKTRRFRIVLTGYVIFGWESPEVVCQCSIPRTLPEILTCLRT